MWFDQLRKMTGEPDMPGREAVAVLLENIGLRPRR